VQPTPFGFEIGDQVAHRLPGCFRAGFVTDVRQRRAAEQDRNATQPAASTSIVIADKFLLQPSNSMAGARVVKCQVHNVDFRYLFTLGEQGVEGKGHHLRLTA
jgi:hypothetical protein